MEKGKKPIQEEDDFFSFLLDYQPNVSLPPLSPGPLPAPSATTVESGTGSEKGSITLDELEAAEVEYYSKFFTMSYTAAPNIQPSPVSQTSNLAPVPVVQADKASVQVSPETSTLQSSTPAPALKVPPFRFRKAMPAQVLADLAVVDPKRAKRIITNRMSAMRAKEKKKLYIFMLEHKLNNLQTQSTSTSAKLALLQAESNCLTAENEKLKEHGMMILQQTHLQELLNNEVRKEIQHLRTLTGRKNPNDRTMNNSIASSRNNNRAMDATFATQEFPDLQVQSPYQQIWHELQQQMQQQRLQQPSNTK